MTFTRTRCLLLILALAALTACERAKSANPLSPDVAGPIPSVSITAPTPIEPSTGAQLKKDSGAPALTVNNATSTGVRPLWMQIELAADNAFTQLLHQADRVTPDGAGKTSYRLALALTAGKTYYWRARALDGANTGPYSAVAHFSVVEPVVLEPPTPVEPVGLQTTNRPEFRARNGKVSGTTGVIYRFEIATAPDPSAIVAVVSATPNGSGTTTTSLGDLPWDKTFYWRM